MTLYVNKKISPPKEITEWEFKQTEDKLMPFITCKANNNYYFSASGNITHIVINDKIHEINPNYTVNRSYISFPEDTKLKLGFALSGIWNKDGYIKIVNKKKVGGYPRLLFLQPNSYNHFSLKVRKGDRLDLLPQADLYYLGYLKDKKLVHEKLVRSVEDKHYHRFWDDYEIKFKAGEIPFFCVCIHHLYMKS